MQPYVFQSHYRAQIYHIINIFLSWSIWSHNITNNNAWFLGPTLGLNVQNSQFTILLP
jgi:hypothetical protein